MGLGFKVEGLETEKKEKGGYAGGADLLLEQGSLRASSTHKRESQTLGPRSNKPFLPELLLQASKNVPKEFTPNPKPKTLRP